MVFDTLIQQPSSCIADVTVSPPQGHSSGVSKQKTPSGGPGPFGSILSGAVTNPASGCGSDWGSETDLGVDSD